MRAPSDLPESQRAEYEAQIAAAHSRYDALRSRKAVRLALAIAAQVQRLATLLRGERPAAPAASTPPPAAPQHADPGPPSGDRGGGALLAPGAFLQSRA